MNKLKYVFFPALNLCQRASLNCTNGCQNDTSGTVSCFCPLGFTLADNKVDCQGMFPKTIKTESATKIPYNSTTLFSASFEDQWY